MITPRYRPGWLGRMIPDDRGEFVDVESHRRLEDERDTWKRCADKGLETVAEIVTRLEHGRALP
jgi:hypothetical protein